MTTLENLFEKWNNISPYSGGFILISEDHSLAFHIGYIADNQKCFVVLNTGKLDRISSSKAINVENILMEDGTYSLRFILNYQSLDEIFVKLCWDLISVSQNDANPIKKIVDQYKKWLKLLHQLGNGLLPSNLQKGLIGELLYLSEMIDLHGEKSALEAWVGPEGSDQDFIFNEGWAEVKTTIIAGTSIQISSLQQLDRLDEGTLVVYLMDKTSSKGQSTVTLNQIVSNVKAKIEEESKSILDIKLAKCGYQNKDADKYSSFRYKIAEKRLYRVSGDFPRLTKYNVPAAVVEVQYKISLPAVDGFRTKED